jgi:cytochrome oxidase assembly protein ShyY1
VAVAVTWIALDVFSTAMFYSFYRRTKHREQDR